MNYAIKINDEIETLDDDISIFNDNNIEGNELTNKINKIREFINNLDDNQIKIEEFDLLGSYQINITIEKN